MASSEEKFSYGFIPEVVGGQQTPPDHQSCFRYDHFSAYLGSHKPDLNPDKQTFEGFPKLGTNTYSTSPLDQAFSPPLAMPSPPEPHDWELLSEDEPNVAFQTKYFESFPLYQIYVQKTEQDEICEVPELDCFDMDQVTCFDTEKITCSESKPLNSPNEIMQSNRWRRSHFKDSLLKSPSEATILPPPLESKMTSCTHWQDLEEVRNSDLLRILTPKEIGLQETMFELMSSEASYLKSLGVLVHHFYGSKALKKTVSRMDHRMMFSNVCQVLAVGARFLQDLETRLQESLFISEVGDIVLKHCKDFRQTYTTYLTTVTFQSALVNQLLDQNQNFAYVLKKLESDPVCQRQSFKSFLVLPFQRITRIKLLLETILKRTQPNSDAALNLDKAINGLHEILMACDKKTRKIKLIEELICLEMTLDFNNIKSIPLVISTRFLIHQGPLKLLNMEGTYSQKISYNKIYLHLFNDLLIISKKYQMFMVVDYTQFPEHVTVENVKSEVLGLSPDSFLLHLSQSQRGRKTAMILVALSQSDKEAWMKALSSK